MSLYILLSRCSSRILDITGKRLIGLYEVTSVGFFPGLGIMMIFACFRGTDQYSNLVVALDMYRRVFQAFRRYFLYQMCCDEIGAGRLEWSEVFDYLFKFTESESL